MTRSPGPILGPKQRLLSALLGAPTRVKLEAALPDTADEDSTRHFIHLVRNLARAQGEIHSQSDPLSWTTHRTGTASHDTTLTLLQSPPSNRICVEDGVGSLIPAHFLWVLLGLGGASLGLTIPVGLFLAEFAHPAALWAVPLAGGVLAYVAARLKYRSAVRADIQKLRAFMQAFASDVSHALERSRSR